MQESLFDDRPGIGDEIGALERWCHRQQLELIVGIDEAGRGPLAGPVHASAVAIDVRRLEADWIELLDDSKKLSAEQRRAAFGEIRESACAWAVAERPPSIIDEINILEATRAAMLEAAEQVCGVLERSPDGLFVDGDVELATERRQRALVRGDARSYAIAAASILAKVSRDRVMEEYGEKWPVFNLASNKGYPTSDHREALEKHGPSPIHRTSFGGVDED